MLEEPMGSARTAYSDGINSFGSLMTKEDADASCPPELTKAIAPRIGAAFHSGAIDSMSLSVRRPLVATCASSPKDASIRVWDYERGRCVVLIIIVVFALFSNFSSLSLNFFKTFSTGASSRSASRGPSAPSA